VTLNITDPKILQSLERKLKHSPPFSSDELETLEILTFKYGRGDFEVLQHCTNIMLLSLSGSEVTDLSWWPASNAMYSADIAFCPVTDLTPLLRCPALKGLDGKATLVEDISLLFEFECFDGVNLVGMPLSDESYHEHLPRLLKWKAPKNRDVVRVRYSPEEEWQMSRELRRRGLRAVYSHAQPGRQMVIAPGLVATRCPDLYSWELTPDELRAVLDEQDWDTTSFMTRCGEVHEQKYLPPGLIAKLAKERAMEAEAQAQAQAEAQSTNAETKSE